MVGNITSLCIPPCDHGNSRNTLDLHNSLSRFFQLVKTEAGGPLEKETCLDCLHAGSVPSMDTQGVNI